MLPWASPVASRRNRTGHEWQEEGASGPPGGWHHSDLADLSPDLSVTWYKKSYRRCARVTRSLLLSLPKAPFLGKVARVGSKPLADQAASLHCPRDLGTRESQAPGRTSYDPHSELHKCDLVFQGPRGSTARPEEAQLLWAQLVTVS